MIANMLNQLRDYLHAATWVEDFLDNLIALPPQDF